jgi:hypothetical protein
MITTGFGRRAPTPQRPGLVLIPDEAAGFPAPAVDLASLSELKERIRTVLLSRIDPTVAGRIPRAALRREVAKLVNEIATEIFWQTARLIFTSSGTASWKRPRPAFATRSILPASRSGSPPQSADALTKRARWSTPGSPTAAGSISSCRR